MPSDRAAIEIRPPSSTRMASMNPSPSLPQKIFGRKHAIFKDQFRGVAGAQAKFVFFLPGTKSLRSLLHDESRQPMGMRGAVGHGNHDQNVGIVAVGAESLGAVQHPVVAFAHRSHARAACVRSGRGLGQSPGADELRREASGVTYFFFWASLPARKIWFEHSEVCAATMMPTEPSTRESSSIAVTYST